MWTHDGVVRKLCQRFNESGHAHELTFSCYQKYPLLGSDVSRLWFVQALEKARQALDFEIWAYVIMPDHAHLILFPRQRIYSISSILKSIKQPVSRQAINQLRKRSSHWLSKLEVRWPNGRVEHRFWQPGGGFDRNVNKIDPLWKMIDYIHRNPVRRGLVPVATDWIWSSARWYAGLADAICKMDLPPVS